VGLHARESALDTGGCTGHRGYSGHRWSCDLDSEEERRTKRVSIEFSNDFITKLALRLTPYADAPRTSIASATSYK
jgi:hypothetical protein